MLVENSSATIDEKYTRNSEALSAYSRGLAFWDLHIREGFNRAINEFKIAIDKDPDFALAHAYLSDSYAHIVIYEPVDKKDGFADKGIAAAKKALELDPECAEALAALSLIYANIGRQSEAFPLMKRSIEIKPTDSHARHRISWMYANKGEIDVAIENMKIARDLNPDSEHMNYFLSKLLYYGEDSAAALKYLKKAKSMASENDQVIFSISVLHLEGKYEEAIKKIETEGKGKTYLKPALSTFYSKIGKKELARKTLNEALKEGMRESNYHVIVAHAWLGDEKRAISGFKKLITQVRDNIYDIKFDPELDPIRKHPEFIRILEEKEREQGW